jgi:chemotaxis protein MotB
VKGIRRSTGEFDLINPYIALTDLLISLAFIFMVFIGGIVFMGRLGQDDVRYRSAQDTFKGAMQAKFSKNVAWNNPGRNDPPGTQRWVFTSSALFRPGTAKLIPGEGTELVLRFASVLRAHSNKWRRIRVEGHTFPPVRGTPDDWNLSSSRAMEIVRLLASEGHIAPHYLSVSGRAGQSPLFKDDKDPRNERVEFLIEYGKKSALGKDVSAF